MLRTLIYDIETSPNLIWAWQLWNTNALKVEQTPYMLSFAYKWLDEKKTEVLALPDYEGYEDDPMDDSGLCGDLYELFNEADVVIAHNGNKFDQRFAKGRFLEHGWSPPAPYIEIDTLKIARREFKFQSNKLDSLGEYLGVGRKVEHEGASLWFKCMAGDLKAWSKMKKYNLQDVDLLEAVYLKLRPWIRNHPNMNKSMSGVKCGRCGSVHLNRRGTRRTGRYEYQRYQCQSCGGWLQERVRSDTTNVPDFVAMGA